MARQRIIVASCQLSSADVSGGGIAGILSLDSEEKLRANDRSVMTHEVNWQVQRGLSSPPLAARSVQTLPPSPSSDPLHGYNLISVQSGASTHFGYSQM